MIKHTILISSENEEAEKNLTPIKAIRWKCLECCNFNSHEVKICSIDNFALYPFRLGKNPGIKRVLSEDQRSALRERLKKARNLKPYKQE
jgi:hypothetical protein